MSILKVTILGALLASPLSYAGEITLYSHRHYPTDDQLFAKFTERSGIEVNIVKGKANELMERLKAEGEKTPADIFITADAGRLVRAKTEGILQSVESDVLTSRIPAQMRDSDNQWFGFTKRARVIAYAKDRVKPADLSTYENLTDEKWKGRILVRSSSNIYNQSLMASLLSVHDENAAIEWAKGVRANMARPPQGSDRDQMRAVAAGLGDIAVVNTYYVGLLANSSEEKDRKVAESIGLFFPNQDGRGTHINISGGGIVKNSDNVEGAKKFLEFLVSDVAQKSFPNGSYEYAVVPDIELSGIQKSWGNFKPDMLDMAKLGELNAKAVECFNKAGWE
ncbi:MAG: Fe(3+) ABC transporter substrate-binding protein [Verrucomicrobiota bacterium]